MKQTQDNFFGRRIGADKNSGVAFPDISQVAKAYNLPFIQIPGDKDLSGQIEAVLNVKGPVVCEVVLPTEYVFAPKRQLVRVSV